MATKIAVFWLTATLALASAIENGQYIITHTPSHVTFLNEADKIQSSEVPSVIASTFGFSINKDLKWNGLGQTSLFARPKANVLVSVDGVPTTLNIQHHSKYEAQNDDPVVNTESVVNKLQSNIAANPLIVDFSVDSTLFDIKSEHPHLFNKLPTTFHKVRQIFQSGLSGFSPASMGSLNFTEDSDLLFLGELHVIHGLLNALKTNPTLSQDGVPDFYHLNIAGLQGLVQRYGKSSSQVRDAMKLLETLLDELTNEFRHLYSDNVIIQVVTTAATVNGADKSHVRKSRSLMADKPAAGADTPGAVATSIEEDVGVTKKYDANYAVMFNIILWGSIILILSLYYISYGMWMMDPGKDSIIYRMTSQRMKKD